MSIPAPEPLWVHCNKCLGTTKHNIVGRHKREGSHTELLDGYGPHEIRWSTTHIFLECGGCESVSMCKRSWDSESMETSEEFYPPEVSRQKPAWAKTLPEEYGELIDEVYAALHANSGALALMGARALIDMFMTKRVGDIGGFERKLEKLVTEGFLSTKNKEVLDAAIDAGSAAAHRGHKPSKSDVGRVMDIVENVLQNDVLEDSAKALRTSTPPRPPAPKAP